MTAIPAKKSASTSINPGSWRSWAPWILGLILLVAGGPAFYSRMVLNHHGDVTSYVPWGVWVAGYVYLVWLEVGSILVYTIITYVLDRPDLKQVGRAVLMTALVALLCALFLIAMDLGQVWRAYKAFTQPNFGSLMTWMIWLHTFYLVLLVSELWINMKPDFAARAGKPLGAAALASLKRTGRTLAFISLPAGVILISVIGGLFGVIAGRPFWSASTLPMVFFISSLVAGCGLITVIAALFWPGNPESQTATVANLRRWTLGLLVVGFFATVVNSLVVIYPAVPAYSEALKMALFGPYGWTIWLGHGLFGLLLPAILLFSPKASINQVGLAALMMVASFVVIPANIIIPGQVLPPESLEGLARAFGDSRLTFDYSPGLMDLQMIIFTAGIGVLMLSAGARFLPISPRKEG